MRRTISRRVNKKSGFTLSELCIVLALVAVVATIVTSFCLVIHQRSAISRARLDIVNEVTVLEAYAQSWVDEMTEQKAVFEKDDKSGALKATVGSDTYKLSLNIEGVLEGERSESVMTFSTTRINSVTFDVVEKEGGGDCIFFCTVTALLPQTNGGEKTEVYTFCINSRIGESFEEVTP